MFKKLPLESRSFVDADTGRTVRQVTACDCINHHPFFLIPAYDDSQRYLYFVSWRSGQPQIYAEDSLEQCILQLTDDTHVDEWSVHPVRQAICYTTDEHAARVFPQDGRQQILLDRQNAAAQLFHTDPAEVHFAAGTTAASKDGGLWAVRMVCGGQYHICIWHEQAAQWTLAYSGPMVSHMQFCPDDDQLLFFAGPLTDRVWVLNLRTGEAKRMFRRNVAAKQWITHESWIPGCKELSLVDWPHGIIGVDVTTGNTRRITDFNAWHAISNSQGTLMAADTNFPDHGIMLFDPTLEHAEPQLLCCPHATCMGAHWNGPFPYDNGPIKVNAPQHTHPHPRFSPDGTKLVYTSDASGFAQLFEITL